MILPGQQYTDQQNPEGLFSKSLTLMLELFEEKNLFNFSILGELGFEDETGDTVGDVVAAGTDQGLHTNCCQN